MRTADIPPAAYAQDCALLQQMTNARLAIVIIAGGDRGDGFSCAVNASNETIARQLADSIPTALRHIADQIEAKINIVTQHDLNPHS
jgi:hypothetical protein